MSRMFGGTRLQIIINFEISLVGLMIFQFDELIFHHFTRIFWRRENYESYNFYMLVKKNGLLYFMALIFLIRNFNFCFE